MSQKPVTSRAAWLKLLLPLGDDELATVQSVIAEIQEERRIRADLSVRGGQVVAQEQRGSVFYQLEGVKCGKLLCRCAAQPDYFHGPYWYSYTYIKDGRTTKRGTTSRWKKTYIGKTRPAELDDGGRGAGSVESDLVDHYRALEAGIAQAIAHQEFDAARQLASLLPNPATHLHAITFYEGAQLRQRSVVAERPASYVAESE